MKKNGVKSIEAHILKPEVLVFLGLQQVMLSTMTELLAEKSGMDSDLLETEIMNVLREQFSPDDLMKLGEKLLLDSNEKLGSNQKEWRQKK